MSFWAGRSSLVTDVQRRAQQSPDASSLGPVGPTIKQLGHDRLWDHSFVLSSVHGVTGGGVGHWHSLAALCCIHQAPFMSCVGRLDPFPLLSGEEGLLLFDGSLLLP